MIWLRIFLVVAVVFSSFSAPMAQAAPPDAKCVLRLDPEIDCPGCEDRLKQTLVNARGVQSAEIDLLNNRIAVRYDAGRINVKALVGRIRVLGYTAQETR